jgi:hypothetical protein
MMNIRYLIVFLFLFIGSTSLWAQELTIYSIPSPYGIDWKSPGQLLKSFIKNSTSKSPNGKTNFAIGHMMVELKDDVRHALVGTSARSTAEMRNNVLFRGYGLGILFASIPGILQEKVENELYVEEGLESGNISFIRYMIDPAVFERLWDYLDGYKQRSYYKIYNGKNKPRQGQGAGCSAFAVSFLEVAGLMDIVPTDEWMINVQAPQYLIGGPPGLNREVGLEEIFTRGRWAESQNESSQQLTFYEPTLLYKYIQKTWKNHVDNDRMKKHTIGNAKGFIIDVTDRACPQEAIWLE